MWNNIHKPSSVPGLAGQPEDWINVDAFRIGNFLREAGMHKPSDKETAT
jgi:hypothetical protein